MESALFEDVERIESICSDPSPSGEPNVASRDLEDLKVKKFARSGALAACFPTPTGLEYAAGWVSRNLKYSQSHYADVNGDHRSSSEFPGSYRTDCSGLVSMAWGLPASYTTRDLFYGTFVGAEKILQQDKRFNADGQRKRMGSRQTSQLIAYEDIRAGDALYYPGHIMLVSAVTGPSDLIIHHQSTGGARKDAIQRIGCEGDMKAGYTGTFRNKKKVRFWCLRVA